MRGRRNYYGDNFPVPMLRSWNPAIPWRFPRSPEAARRFWTRRLAPWLMLVLGVGLGMLAMNFRGPAAGAGRSQVVPAAPEEALQAPVHQAPRPVHRPAMKKGLA